MEKDDTAIPSFSHIVRSQLATPRFLRIYFWHEIQIESNDATANEEITLGMKSDVVFIRSTLMKSTQALKTLKGISFDTPKFRPGKVYPPIEDHIHLLRIGGSSGALYGCCANASTHSKRTDFLVGLLSNISCQLCHLNRSWNYVSAL